MLNKIICGAVFLIFYSLLFSSCKQAEPKKEILSDTVNSVKEVEIFQAGTIVRHTTPDGLSYSIYTPRNFSKQKKYSIIVFLDPHGNGSYPLKLYRNTADKFEVILIGSNDSKNGTPIENGIRIVQGIADQCKLIPYADGRLSIAGFSGGAKMALISGSSVPGFTSIIYSGAALPAGTIVPGSSLLGFAGKKDMNYTEVKNFSLASKSQSKESGVVEWQGKHEWPDSATFRHAFYWHLLSGEKNKNDKLVDEYENFILKVVENEKNPLRKVEYLNDGIALLEKYRSVMNLKSEIRKIVLSKDYSKAKSVEAAMLSSEDVSKQMLLESFKTQDLNWWKNEIKKLSVTNSESNQRLLGYISLASWSYSTNAIESNDFPFALKVLEIYQMADPENSEHQYLKSCLYGKNNINDSAIYFLDQAIKLGFNDRARIDNEKNLVTVRGSVNFNEAVSKIRIEN